MPTADEVWRLQKGSDADCKFFQAFADGGHYRGKGGTRQGIYVCTPSGKLLASANTLDANRVLELLRGALKKWDALPPHERHLPEGIDLTPRHRWEDSFPSKGLVLVSTNRDLPLDGKPDAPRGGRWNRDHVWFSSEEAKAWLPPNPRPGASHRLPDRLARRLARFHLVDNVRGQTQPFASEEVCEGRIVVEVADVKGTTLRLKISGSTHVVADGPWLLGDVHWKPRKHHAHGVRTRLLGRATYDLQRGAFTEFELVAVGRRWGVTQNNGRGKDVGPAPIGFVFSIAPRSDAHRVAPTFVDMYGVDWVIHP